ncbi:hypothetical protein E3N88_30880 [Mikania micrantha]|uniref:CCHC-type domain-containing protein n=1 Tax=Mikania micrantha TaxID=192012 RepID=A0A5N6MNQ4_9ASTR|nr:hypothetical protein E3N88_30880 [Mikania micrantha]
MWTLPWSGFIRMRAVNQFEDRRPVILLSKQFKTQFILQSKMPAYSTLNGCQIQQTATAFLRIEAPPGELFRPSPNYHFYSRRKQGGTVVGNPDDVALTKQLGFIIGIQIDPYDYESPTTGQLEVVEEKARSKKIRNLVFLISSSKISKRQEAREFSKRKIASSARKTSSKKERLASNESKKFSFGRGRGRESKNKNEFRCYECGEFGHFAYECTKWKEEVAPLAQFGDDGNPALL